MKALDRKIADTNVAKPGGQSMVSLFNTFSELESKKQDDTAMKNTYNAAPVFNVELALETFVKLRRMHALPAHRRSSLKPQQPQQQQQCIQ